MKTILRQGLSVCLFLILFGFVLLNGSANAFAADWVEGRLVKITGNKNAEVTDKTKTPDLSNVILTMDWDKTFGLDQNVRIKDMKGKYVAVGTIDPPMKVRYLAEEGMIQEMVIMEIFLK
ncbi:MAG: hypothetical protein HY886_09100 [Deltaproteobacteria bacterium]|nr:hypothetical protein [Deltaproteobacteria bacterium]